MAPKALPVIAHPPKARRALPVTAHVARMVLPVTAYIAQIGLVVTDQPPTASTNTTLKPAAGFVNGILDKIPRESEHFRAACYCGQLDGVSPPGGQERECSFNT